MIYDKPSLWIMKESGSFSMALCTIVIRRCFDTVINQTSLPPPTSNLTSLSTMLVSGALLYLFKHLKKGTLVSIGQRFQKTLTTKNISLRSKKQNPCWFMRNLCGKRKSCTDAILKLSEQLVSPQSHFFRSSNCESESSSMESFADADSLGNDINGIVGNSCEPLYRRNSARLSSRRAIGVGRASMGDLEGRFNGSGDNGSVRRSVVKRLGRRNSVCAVVDAGATSWSEKRKTRSGRVYNPF